MIGQLTRLWRMRPYLTSAFVLACAVTVFFMGSTVYSAVYRAAHRDVEVRPWMPVGYLARSWDLDPRKPDPRKLVEIAGLPLPKVKGHPQPLSEIARDRGVSVKVVITEVERVSAVLRALRQHR